MTPGAMDIEENDLGEDHHRGYTADDTRRVAGAIQTSDATWSAGVPLVLEGATWRPHLHSGNAQLHIHLSAQLMPYALKRLRLARASGYEPHLAVPVAALYDEALMLELVGIEPLIHVIIDSDTVLGPLPLLRVLGQRVTVSPAVRTAIGLIGWDLVIGPGTKTEKGRRLEGLLCFLFGQVRDLEVSEVNLLTETEELDIVITVRSTRGERCWEIAGSPFLIVEAKNWHTQSVGQAEVSAFVAKITLKGGTVRLGIMVSSVQGFSNEARMQTLRMSATDVTIALLHGGDMKSWIESDDGDAVLESLIRREMLS